MSNDGQQTICVISLLEDDVWVLIRIVRYLG